MKVERRDSSKPLSSGTRPFVVNESPTSLYFFAWTAGAVFGFCIAFRCLKVNDKPVASEGAQQEPTLNVRIIYRY